MVSEEMSIIALISNADIVVKLVIAILTIASLWSWTIIFDKVFVFSRILRKTNKFEKIFWSGQLLEQLYERVRAKTDHPIAAVFVSAMYEWGRQDVKKLDQSILAGIKERIFQAMEVSKSKEITKIENNIHILAIIASASPFIGLFGTVWGIMDSFQSIAVQKSVSLAVVAPGIAESLVATGVGLVAAIPALIFYNIFTNKINKINIRIDDFSNELGALISRELDQGDEK